MVNSEIGVSTASSNFSSNDAGEDGFGEGADRDKLTVIRLNALIEIEGQAPRALTHESQASSIILGRDASADFQIPLSTISRQHARIAEADGVYIIEDLGSTHGTILNTRKMGKGEKKVLKDGDLIELTKARVKVNIEQASQMEMPNGEGTKAIAARAVQSILGKLGDARSGAFFRVLNGADEGTRFTMQSNFSEWVFGRSKDCEFVLNDPNVSRRHARVKRDWNGFLVEDMGSKNGVLVNDQLVKKTRRLKDRDELTIGPVKVVFIDPDADLLRALEDVHGFPQDEMAGDPEVNTGDPSVIGEPMEGEGTSGSEGPEHLEGEGTMSPEGGEHEEGPDGPDNIAEVDIDPSLLENKPSRLANEWVIIGLAAVLLLACVGLILVILT